jgi:hypothetical protein
MIEKIRNAYRIFMAEIPLPVATWKTRREMEGYH